MIFRQLFDATSCTYTYLLADHHQALLIDPVIEQIELYKTLVQELGLKLVMSIDSHTHADHITASGALNGAYQCQIAMGEQTKARCITHRFKDGEKIMLGECEITAIYTPGHTDDSYSFVMPDRVFTGDLLLIRGTGRTDFQSGNPLQSYDSIINKIFRLHDNTLIYPGHDYRGMTVSSVGEEKQFNPRLHKKSAKEYAEIMNNLNLPKPKLIDIAVPANLNCGLLINTRS